MNSIIDITKISNLPSEKLSIIKDLNDGVCLGIKSNSIAISNIEFNANNELLDNFSAYSLMIKCNNSTTYKCLIPLDNDNNKNTIHKLINLDRFNLIVFRDNMEHDVFRIENTNKLHLNEMFQKAIN